MKVVARSRRDYDREVVSLETSHWNDGESMVQQQFAKDADINEIVRRFGLTGELPPPRPEGYYGDFSAITDFQSALEQLERARSGFEELPPEIREEFHNDPAGFVDWLADPGNWPEARRMGLLEEEKTSPADVDSVAVSGVLPGSEVSTA